ncbi:nucleoporin Nup186/Nup192/Nup205 [Lineolata rhizophorae]|uniref:Nucleoporin Nup186/Nup192/Nup205 n=1 Tax=Lineolata rhizophorae TaxID=578093 RepID=A0A6A6NNA6_9PEZI|nr:nucleoporin Nup186/Nup192/Nup205 [Lineolata rhizophorae]
MAEEDDGGLEWLHRDLLALSELRLPNVDRLWAQLEVRLDEFRRLLEKPGRNDTSRNALNTGRITIDDTEYQVNDDFKNDTAEIADALDLDELRAARLYLHAQQRSHEYDRRPLLAAILTFHKRREFLLECLRILVSLAVDTDTDDEKLPGEVREALRRSVRLVLNVQNGNVSNGSTFFRRCIADLTNMERWLQGLANRLQALSVIGQTMSAEGVEMINFQTASLTRQHESLASIATQLVRSGYTSLGDLRHSLDVVRNLDRYGVTLLHHIPILMALMAQFGSSDGNATLCDVRKLHEVVVSPGARDADAWSIRSFHAAVIVWWLGEYSGRYVDAAPGVQSPLDDVDLEAEAEQRSKRFMEALRDGALHFMLTCCEDVRRPRDWVDPVRSGIMSALLASQHYSYEAYSVGEDAPPAAEHFRTLFMEGMQGFVESFITNMPDTLRKLKLEEDEARRQLQSRFQRPPAASSRQANSSTTGERTGQPPVEYELHLERFLILIALAFQGSPSGAIDFWQDPEDNLFGFLQWAAKRQTTPRAAAFCEMLRALSEGEACAGMAHRFLLDDSPTASSSGKLRRSSTLSWNQIFAELRFYATALKERSSGSSLPPYLQHQQQNQQPHLSSSFANGTTQHQLHHASSATAAAAAAAQFVEPESIFMLECYLRLLAHLARESRVARAFILEHQSFSFREVLFALCADPAGSSGAAPLAAFIHTHHAQRDRLRAAALDALAALLTDKTGPLRDAVWASLDAWINTAGLPPAVAAAASQAFAHTTGPPGTPQPLPSSPWNEAAAFEPLAAGFEEPDAFVRFLLSLVTPGAADAEEVVLGIAAAAPQEDGGGQAVGLVEGGGTYLHDGLPFPEQLGANYRTQVGMEPYVDFAVGRVFGEKTTRESEMGSLKEGQLSILRLNCLNFIGACLDTWNDDLVLLANGQSAVPVEHLMLAGSLEIYCRLHPFGRVMEWMFNTKVIEALFATAHQDVSAINDAQSDSPLVLALLKAIQVIDRVLQLQATYFSILHPLLRKEAEKNSGVARSRSKPVVTSAISSFEDAILNHLNIVVDLGLYCGTGHQDLTVASLKLLQTLSSNRKLAASPTAGFGSRSKIIGVLEREGDAERIAHTLTDAMAMDDQELEAWPNSPGYDIKVHVLDFLNKCLETVPDRPSMAHLLLGFTCVGGTAVEIADDSLFAKGLSLFHAVLRIAVLLPDADVAPVGGPTGGAANNFVPWLCSLKARANAVLTKLWRSPLTAVYTLTELRANETLFLQACATRIVESGAALFSGMSPAQSVDFIIKNDAVAAYVGFLRSRAAFFEYAARELRATVTNGTPSLRARILASLLGTTQLPPGLVEGNQPVENPTIFDLFDFVELDVVSAARLLPARDPPFIGPIVDAIHAVCTVPASEGAGDGFKFDMHRVEMMLAFRLREIRVRVMEGAPGAPVGPTEEEQVFMEAGHTFQVLGAQNARREVEDSRRAALHSWAQLVTVVVGSCGEREFGGHEVAPEDTKKDGGTRDQVRGLATLREKLGSIGEKGKDDGSGACQGGAQRGVGHGLKAGFVLQAIQVILPKLEKAFATQDHFAAVELAGLASKMLQAVDFGVATGMRPKRGSSNDYNRGRNGASLFASSLALSTVAADANGTRTGTGGASRAADFANARLFQLFRVALSGIALTDSPPLLREMCYQIAFRYLRGLAGAVPTTSRDNDGSAGINGSINGASTRGPDVNGTRTPSSRALTRSTSGPLSQLNARYAQGGAPAGGSKSSPQIRHTIRAVKAAGARVVEVACDDAYGGEGTWRVSALIFLDGLVALCMREGDAFLLEALEKSNFVGVLVDAVKGVPEAVVAVGRGDMPLLLSYYDAALALLLRIAQTKVGAALVLNAGLFAAVRESMLFSVDPDIGLDTDTLIPLTSYYTLLLSVLSVINAAVLSRGPQHDATMAQAQRFLADHRHAVVGIFKRYAGIGRGGFGQRSGIGKEEMRVLNELVDGFTLLISATSFLEFEERTTFSKSPLQMFS